MPKFTHVFATHSALQEQLAAALVRQCSIDPAGVLLLHTRGSYRPPGKGGFTVVNGDNYRIPTTYNLVRQRKLHLFAHARFTVEVLDHLAPEFEIFAPMYTYWYLRHLRVRARAYHLVEDGFGSYQTLAEHERFFRRGRKRSVRQRWRDYLRSLTLVPDQRAPVPSVRELFAGATSVVTTSAACFPFIEPARKRVVADPFPPRYVGEFTGAWIWGTSCLVETGNVDLSTYLNMLRRVLDSLAARGVSVVHLKYHPAQRANPDHLAAYRRVLLRADAPVRIVELDPDVSLECLAAGNAITFVTGISTLAFHVAATGATVLTYLPEVERMGPAATAHLARGGMEVFRRLTTSL